MQDESRDLGFRYQLKVGAFIVGLFVAGRLPLPPLVNIAIMLAITIWLNPGGRTWGPALVTAPLVILYAVLLFADLSSAVYSSLSAAFLVYLVLALVFLFARFAKSTSEVVGFLFMARNSRRQLALKDRDVR